MFECPGFVAQFAQRGAQIGVGHRVVGSRFQHGQERAGRLGMAPQDMQGQPKVVAGGGVVQPEPNRLTTAGDGFFELAQGTMDLGQRGVEDGHIGRKPTALPISLAARRFWPC